MLASHKIAFCCYLFSQAARIPNETMVAKNKTIHMA
jgi:hypothetical protein